ncbi:hypothetical protein Poli38472_002346 [Pythium oligandrum]|uniref:Uncharacterized protein n=1 Tax=Pythium oligandrum TaxID=41045 RepID=A0A8K1FH18_PYTOL|nr:hypothetical protein Poli38472_002346 [Pythium oligandrum]|eukprot:TMW63405.1 hypothetical protein Poli38472_002346 [Pythium oligandrum]
MTNHTNVGRPEDHVVTPPTPQDVNYIAISEEVASPDQEAPSKPVPDESQLAVRKLILVTVIALTFMLMEFIGGYIAGSLAVISDAVHMLTDVLGFAIALTAIWIGRKPPSDRHSFGFHRVEVVGALVSIMVIWVLTGILFYSAVLRFQEFLEDDAEQVVDGKTMFIIALIGLIMNVVMMKVLGGDGHGHSHGIGGHDHSHDHSHGEEGHGHSHGSSHSRGHGHAHNHDHDSHSHNHDHEHHSDHEHLDAEATQDEAKPKKKSWCGLWESKFENLNIQAAYLHVLGDLLQSVGVTIAGAIIWWKPSWQLADPIMTFVFSLLVVGTTINTVKESLHILLEGTPRKFQYTKVERGLRSCPEVVAVHDLHIWSLSSNKPALAVHLVSSNPEVSLAAAQQYLIGEGITHTTIQIEHPATQYPQKCSDEGRCT